MTFNPDEPITLETIKNVLVDHENAILNTSYVLKKTTNLNLGGNPKNSSELKIFSNRKSLPITETTGRINFNVPFNSPPAVTLTVEQKDPFFVTAVVKSVTNTEVDYAIFYSGNINVQNYTLHIIAVGY